jgi:catechol 2,3-dioxygenase-like lactoylglutathione lyase family enzyme
VQAPDGTIWKIAPESKKSTAPATRQIDGIVLLLGVADMRESKRFYVDRGLTVAKRYGSKYRERKEARDAHTADREDTGRAAELGVDLGRRDGGPAKNVSGLDERKQAMETAAKIQ